jgi:hypothetical protein
MIPTINGLITSASWNFHHNCQLSASGGLRPMLIRAYGMYWNPDITDWGRQGAGNQGKLLGKIKRNGTSHTIDFWNAFGIYVLHDEFRCIYIGQAASTRLGPRLRNHLTDRFAGRWDMYSWFSLSKVNVTTSSTSDPGTRQVSQTIVNDTLEAISILIADPPLNRKRESIPAALEAKQSKSPYPKTVRHYLEQILDRLPEQPDSLS